MSKIRAILATLLSIQLISCGDGAATKQEEAPIKVSTPVTITTIQTSPISEMISFNAVSVYQRKNIVKSNITGYIDKSFVNQGEIVKIGQPLYAVKTKEGDALSKFSARDSTLNFKSKLTIFSPASGVIIEATRQTNDYIADGEQLCILASQSSFVFILNVPFEQNKFAAVGKKCTILLPDSTLLSGTISGKLSTVDPVSQTQSFIVKPVVNTILPENLSVLVQIIKSSKSNAPVLDKACVLSDETMENFWVMKLINDTIALKTAIKPGITAGNQVEILSPLFSPIDRIINKGNYGLSDTAYVKIIQH